ncbi:TPA: hypothetical protein MIX73_29550 [Klebsiella pneumoniae]|nr:hypothetical protein [Klebsiella pneumoniae]
MINHEILSERHSQSLNPSHNINPTHHTPHTTHHTPHTTHHTPHTTHHTPHTIPPHPLNTSRRCHATNPSCG